jgi:DNA (cytosine-5)-methyltransferase 1
MTWRMLDTFSGIGGFSLAAAWTGRIQTVQFIEIDPFCRRVLAKHWPEVPIHDDIRTFLADTSDLRCNGSTTLAGGIGTGEGGRRLRESAGGRLDLITGGFPCQPWSAAGKQQGTADDRDLWPELHRLVVSLRPRWGIFENVPGIIRMAGGLDRVLADLEASGYATGTVVVPAAAVGAYHRRDRVWIVAHAERADGNGSIKHGGTRGRCGLTDRRDVADPPHGGLRRGCPSGEPGLAAQCGQDAADTAGHLRRASGHGGRVTSNGTSGSECNNGHEALRRLGDAPDGLPGWVAGRVAFGPDWEAGIPRVTTHEVDRVNKLKALGNAIVPEVAYELMMMMLAVDDEMREVE